MTQDLHKRETVPQEELSQCTPGFEHGTDRTQDVKCTSTKMGGECLHTRIRHWLYSAHTVVQKHYRLPKRQYSPGKVDLTHTYTSQFTHTYSLYSCPR